MGLKQCRSCGHPVESGQEACPSCGEPTSRRSRVLVVAIAVAAVALTAGVFIALFQPGLVTRRPATPQAAGEAVEQQMGRLLADGVVTKAEGHDIWIEPVLWGMRSEQEKSKIAELCAAFGALRSGPAGAGCRVRDNRTGAVIAQWSASAGLRPATP